jgi:hypothetical protein
MFHKLPMFYLNQGYGASFEKKTLESVFFKVKTQPTPYWEAKIPHNVHFIVFGIFISSIAWEMRNNGLVFFNPAFHMIIVPNS